MAVVRSWLKVWKTAYVSGSNFVKYFEKSTSPLPTFINKEMMEYGNIIIYYGCNKTFNV